MEFISLIRECETAQVESVVYYADFDAVIRQNRGPFKTPANFAMTPIIVGNLHAMRRQHRREEMEFFFDQDVVKPNELRMAYRLLRWRLSDADKVLLPHEPIVRDDKRFVALQAADLYAWHVRRDHFERTQGRTLSTNLWSALNCHSLLHCSSDRQLMTEIVNNLPSWPRHLPKLYLAGCANFKAGHYLMQVSIVIRRHTRRRLVSISVTHNPTAQWIAGQVTDAFPWDEAPRHLIRDRDDAFGPAYTAAFVQWESEITPPHHARRGRTATLVGSSDRYVANLWTTSSCLAKRTCTVF
jgi:hypothetical protein